MNNALFIVMIEDDDGHARLIEKTLRRAGVECPVIHFRTGGDAVAYLKKWPTTPADAPLVLLDLNLPDMTGTDVLAIIRKSAELRHLPVVVLTTTDDSSEIERCYELGCMACLTKPQMFHRLVEVIRDCRQSLPVVQIPQTAKAEDRRMFRAERR